MTVGTLLRRTNAANALRQREGEAKKARLLDRCRILMKAGNFRPTSAEIAGQGAPHDIINRFGSIGELYDQALDEPTVAAIADRVFNGPITDQLTGRERLRLALAAVHGRLGS